EFNIPLLRNLPFVKAFDVDGAARVQDFSTSGVDETWNGSIAWTVNDDLRFRGGISQSVRTPNTDELFSPPGQSFIGITDPCGPTLINANAARARNCAAAVPKGFDPAQTPFGGIAALVGGNPNLKAEVAHGVTAGLVVTPKILSGF